MPEVFTSAVVAAPAGEVWALLRDFGAISSWHPGLPPCEIDNGPADRVGCTRVFPLAGGHRETLASLDDRRRTLGFTFADNAGGLPVRNYRSQLAARPVTVSNHTCVEWSSEFDCDHADTAKVVAQVRDGILLPGLTALAERFAPAR